MNHPLFGLLGVAAILLLAFLFSSDYRAVWIRRPLVNIYYIVMASLGSVRAALNDVPVLGTISKILLPDGAKVKEKLVAARARSEEAMETKLKVRPRAIIPAFILQILIAWFVLYDGPYTFKVEVDVENPDILVEAMVENEAGEMVKTMVPEVTQELVPVGKVALEGMARGAQNVLNYANEGITFLFGSLVPTQPAFSFLVLVLPVIVFFGALMEVLYHIGIMQFIVKLGGRALQFITGTRPIESLNAVANVFVGQTEAPLSLKPYLPTVTKFELFTLMVSGLASIAGSVLFGYIGMGISPEYLIAACFMTAPAALMMAKIMMPDPKPTAAEAKQVFESTNHESKHRNVILAAAVGTQNGLMLAVNVGAMVMVFVALVALLNGILGALGSLVGIEGLTLQMLLGYFFAPIMYLMNVPWEEAVRAGGFFGEKISTNEFVAYLNLKAAMAGEQPFSEYTYAVLIFSLCGFANLSSIGILLGGLGSLVPEKMGDIAEMGVKAVLAASLANLLNAAVAGIMLSMSGMIG